MDVLWTVLTGSLLLLAIVVVWVVIVGAIVGIVRWARGGFAARDGVEVGGLMPVPPPGGWGVGTRPDGPAPTKRRRLHDG